MTKNIICGVAATKSFLNILEPCIRRIDAAVNHARSMADVTIVICTDKESLKQVHTMMTSRYEGTDRKFKVLTVDMTESGVNYSNERQILIANLQSVLFDYARLQNADLFWMVESDVLVPHNALTCSLQMLEFDDGYYDVSFVTYPCQSGGAFLGGRGTERHPIGQDHLQEERTVPENLTNEFEELKSQDKKCAEEMDSLIPKNKEEDTKQRKASFEKVRKKRDEINEKISEINKKIEECPPKGNVFELNAAKWRARGWLDNAYPAIGRGAVLPSDWTGLGCTLISRKALNCSHFDGYEGKGTQDLFLNWKRWYPEGMKFCVITHTVCEHVIMKNDKRVLCFAHHANEGETKGHLRKEEYKYFKFDGADYFDPKEETSPKKETKK
jgi:hypothetical protein